MSPLRLPIPPLRPSEPSRIPEVGGGLEDVGVRFPLGAWWKLLAADRFAGWGGLWSGSAAVCGRADRRDVCVTFGSWPAIQR